MRRNGLSPRPTPSETKPKSPFFPAGVPGSISREAPRYEQEHIDDKVLKSYRDSAGKTTTVDYDDSLRPVTINDRRGESTSITYDAPSGLKKSVTNPEGAAIAYAYETQTQSFAEGVTFDFHVLARIDYSDGTFETLSRDGKGNITSYRDRLGTSGRPRRSGATGGEVTNRRMENALSVITTTHLSYTNTPPRRQSLLPVRPVPAPRQDGFPDDSETTASWTCGAA
jgi:YD repeat-containing protein